MYLQLLNDQYCGPPASKNLVELYLFINDSNLDRD